MGRDFFVIFRVILNHHKFASKMKYFKPEAREGCIEISEVYFFSPTNFKIMFEVMMWGSN